VGSGFRTFTAGEVLTASNVQNYLMDQSVMTFGGSATRASAIGTANFEEGMVSYLTDTDKMEVYNGTNWVSVAPTASTPMGVLINSTSFSAVASQSINDVFSATYDSYRIVIPKVIPAAGTPTIRLKFRVSATDSSTQYYYGGISSASNSDTTVYRRADNDSSFDISPASANYTFGNVIDVHNPFVVGRTIFNYSISGDDGSKYFGGSGSGFHNVSASYTGLTIFPSSSTITGSISIYGYNK
jgi:hypothetical protein